ncbi:TRAM, LAG1 and CLN8 (TLC) lipid-sensing domain containing protein [Actinidia rufa]|uniref:TRAM, LAG1 and CLN8 (TLC) lipid-sensing domain containing protein n=1 Tax=Actinidia rufa TaxID=165716 RepID=A0A7J0F9S5_9ERIC|nr:TRAM, LAG1 and CLN8 (TLC) lipid-sensing domain containing protein [Actinidia rufa]
MRMAVHKKTAMAFKSYQNQAEVLVKNYLLADSFIPYSSVLGGMFACKLVYDLSQLASVFYFKSYAALTKVQRIEWNNRAVSTVHAIFIASLSLYFVFWSELFSDRQHTGLVTFRSSQLSTFSLGVSVGYFVADLGMIFWLYPSLGGIEYIVHHSLSAIAVAYAMFTGEGQLYTFMVLISEVTTPEINMRWYLDTAGLKRSNAYLINGVVIFFAWLVARILLFVYMFYHVYLHYHQVIQMHIIGFLFGICGAFCACYNELDLVREDCQGIEEDFGKEAVTEIIGPKCPWSKSVSSSFLHRVNWLVEEEKVKEIL